MPTTAPALRRLHPDSPLRERLRLAVEGGHEIEVQEHGAAQGLPALVLHGGPGSGSSPLLRRFLDPARFRIVGVDQRGAGASRPRGAIEDNHTAHLLSDLRAVRRALGIGRWLVVGGSWGATLALAHAADEPAAVAALLLRASFLARDDDIARFFHGTRPLAQLAAQLHGADEEARRDAARTWWQWENTQTGATAAAPLEGEALASLVDRYRVQSHYLIHGCFLRERPLLARCADVPRVPTLLLHGRADRVCPPEGAALLQRALPHAALRWIDGAGHDPTHEAMVDACVRALDRYARAGDFDAFGDEARP